MMIIMIALFGGLALDAVFGLRGPFTIGLLLLSIPFSLFYHGRLALVRSSRLRPLSRTIYGNHLNRTRDNV